MGEFERKVRADIEKKYGSIPKMSTEVGIPRNTIYHALERGLDNTTTKTRNAILDAVYGPKDETLAVSPAPSLSPDERELVDLWRRMDSDSRALLLGMAGKLADQSEMAAGR